MIDFLKKDWHIDFKSLSEEQKTNVLQTIGQLWAQNDIKNYAKLLRGEYDILEHYPHIGCFDSDGPDVEVWISVYSGEHKELSYEDFMWYFNKRFVTTDQLKDIYRNCDSVVKRCIISNLQHDLSTNTPVSRSVLEKCYENCDDHSRNYITSIIGRSEPSQCNINTSQWYKLGDIPIYILESFGNYIYKVIKVVDGEWNIITIQLKYTLLQPLDILEEKSIIIEHAKTKGYSKDNIENSNFNISGNRQSFLDNVDQWTYTGGSLYTEKPGLGGYCVYRNGSWANKNE